MIPALVYSDVAGQRIVAVFLKLFADLNAFLNRAACFVLAEKGGMAHSESGCIAFKSKTHEHGVIRSAHLLNTLNHFFCKAQSIFKAAAVFVGSVVCKAQCELIHQVAVMHCVHLNSIKSCRLAYTGALNLEFDLALYLVVSKLTDGEVRIKKRRVE